MPRIFSRRADSPVYREIISHAIKTAWNERRFWPLAFFASLLLTGGTYDIILKAIRTASEQGAYFNQTTLGINEIGSTLSLVVTDPGNILGLASGLQAVIAVALVFLSLIAISCVSQAGLVYALGSLKRGGRPKLSDAFRIGGGAFWPVLALNALVLSTLWILRFLVAFSLYLALDEKTVATQILYMLSFFVFISLTFVVSIVQIFALNAMVLQGAPVSEALIRGYQLFKKNWMITLETALILMLIAVGMVALFISLLFLAILPLLAAVISAAVLQSSFVFYGALGVGLAFFFIGVILASAFLTQLQYATWTYLYRRLGEGGALPKLHRWYRALTGSFSVPDR
ncbi:MAG: hypothetical protein ABIB04_04505 [Patescibacteria group bacterium]